MESVFSVVMYAINDYEKELNFSKYELKLKKLIENRIEMKNDLLINMEDDYILGLMDKLLLLINHECVIYIVRKDLKNELENIGLPIPSIRDKRVFIDIDVIDKDNGKEYIATYPVEEFFYKEKTIEEIYECQYIIRDILDIVFIRIRETMFRKEKRK